MRFGWIQALANLPLALDVTLKVTSLLVLTWVINLTLRRRNPRWWALLWRGVVVEPVILSLLSQATVMGAPGGLKISRAQDTPARASAAVVTGMPLRNRGEPRSRVLRFPRDRSLGSLKVKDISADAGADVLDFGRAEYEGWEYLGQAVGDVSVPAGKLVGLWVHPAALDNLSGLGRLRPDDLHILWLSGSSGPDGATPDDRCMVHLRSLTGLSVLMLNNTNVTDRGLGWIRGLKSLKKLYLKSDRLTDAALAQLAELKALEILEVMSSGITDAGLRHLENLRSLRELYIWGPKIRGRGLVRLANLPSLRNLNLEGNHFDADGLKYLRNVRSVKKLNIRAMVNLTDAGLADVANLAQLTDLNLADTPVGDRDLAHLSKLANLERLDLYNTAIGDEGLVNLKRLGSLKSLNLWKTTNKKGKITDKGLAHLREIKSLERLELSGPAITHEGLAHVAELRRLKYLCISGGHITDAGLSHLPKLRALECLKIGGPGIADVGMSYIGKLTGLRDLMILSGPGVTNAGLAELKPLRFLTRLDLGHETGISIAGLAHLNALPGLVDLRAGNVRQDNSGLNIAGLTRLEELSLFVGRQETLRDEDLSCLARLTRLKSLQLGPHESVISDAGIKHLAGLTSLGFLNVGGRRFTDNGLRYVANMRNLWHLRITGDFTEKGLRYLGPLEQLSILSITSESAFSKRALDRLRSKLPNLQIFTVVP